MSRSWLWTHPAVVAVAAAILAAAVDGAILGIWALLGDIAAHNAGDNWYTRLGNPSFDWAHVFAGVVWIGVFVGGIMRCLLHVTSHAVAEAGADEDVVKSMTLSAEETLALEKWIETKQCQWEQLRRLWS